MSLWRRTRRPKADHPETESIPGYRGLEQIGRGGFSVVYRAHQEQLDRQVAVKVLAVEFVDAQVRKGFVREVQMTGRLTGHPNVVTVLDSGLTAWGRPFIVMDYYERGSLHDLLAASGPLPLADVLRVGIKIAGALAAAHQEGILHRDIKPQNILVSRYDEPALADFGTARMAAALEISSRTDALTPVHTAPEVLQGKAASVASDVYSLGSTLFHLLAGRPPYQSDGGGIAGLLLRVLSDEQPSLLRANVPASVVALLRRAMARDPIARFADAEGSARRSRVCRPSSACGALNPPCPAGRRRPWPARSITEPATRAGTASSDAADLAYVGAPVSGTTGQHTGSSVRFDPTSVGPTLTGLVAPRHPPRLIDGDAGTPSAVRGPTPLVVAPAPARPLAPDDTIWVNGSTRSRRKLRLLSILGVVALMLGALTVPLWLGRTGISAGAPGPGASVSASAAAAAGPSGVVGAPGPGPGSVPAPGTPRATDDGAAVRLQWSLAAGANVYPVLVQVAPAVGSSQLIPLPGGTTSYVATGLSASGGYCFLVGLLLQLGTASQPPIEVWSMPTCIRGAIAAVPSG